MRKSRCVIDGLNKRELNPMKPQQFNFMKNWETIKSLQNKFGIRHGIEIIWQEWTDLVDFVLGVAETFYPDSEWETLERDGYCVVTDTDRTIVFDFFNFDELPAGASLVLAGDKKYRADKADLIAAIEYKQQGISRLERALKKMCQEVEWILLH